MKRLWLVGFVLWVVCPVFADKPILNSMARLGVVHYDATDLSTLYQYMAAVPVSVFHREGNVYQFPLITDNEEVKSIKYFLEDWDKYLSEFGGIKELLLVGEVKPALVASLKKKYPKAVVVEIKGNPVEVAEQLAARYWTATPIAVRVAFQSVPVTGDVENLANAAVLASLNACPLVYKAPSSPVIVNPPPMPQPSTNPVPSSTWYVLRNLGVRQLIDCGEEAETLAWADGPITAYPVPSPLSYLVEQIMPRMERTTVCFIDTPGKAMAAVLSAARYRGFVSFLPQGINAYWGDMVEEEKLLSPYKLPMPFIGMPEAPAQRQKFAENFYDWLGKIKADNPKSLETILTFCDKSALPYEFERILTGNPDDPTGRGAITGRFPGNAEENVGYALRGIFYPYLAVGNLIPNHVTMVMVAYEVEYPACSLSFKDTNGVVHKVNELYGTYAENYQDPGCWETWKKRGYDVEFHSGWQENPRRFHPIDTKPSTGFVWELERGTSFLYVSCHGSDNAIHVNAKDEGILADLPWGTPFWPSKNGRVNKSSSGFTDQEMDREYGNIKSAISVYNACLVGRGNINKIFLDHGGAAAISSVTSVSFHGCGWYCCAFVEGITKSGITIGEANSRSLALTSEIFPSNRMGGDSSLRLLIFGDPNIEYLKPDWKRQAPAF